MTIAIEQPAAAARAPIPRRQVAAITAGNALEFYDFLTYAFFAAQIGRTFFPSTDATGSLLASLATFGAGFLMRPVGALVIGRIGDRAGRKPAMLLTFALMGVAIVGLAITPGYAAIGVAAPLLAVLFRLVQGFALGGEVGPNTAFLVEAAPANRRGFYVSLQSMSQFLAILASGLVGFALSNLLTDAQLTAWGWRAAFLLGAVIVPFGLVLRRQLQETLADPGAAPSAHEASLGKGLVVTVALGVVMLLGGTTGNYVLSYMTTFATATLHMPTRTGFLATITLGLTGAVVAVASGLLSDRVGRKPVMLVAWVVLLFITLPGFILLIHLRNAAALVGVTFALTVAEQFAMAAMMVTIAESMPARIRAGAMGLIYAVSVSVFGGSTQFTVAWLTRLTGSPLAPAGYLTACAAIALVAIIAMPETAPGRAGAASATA